jgi:Polysaccharide pyruvyl transferase
MSLSTELLCAHLVLVIGYYGSNNWGDEAFRPAISSCLHPDQKNDFTLIFRSPDDIEQMIKDEKCDLSKISCIIVGGGDVMVSYFQNVVYAVARFLAARHGKKVPVIALGVGFGFESMLIPQSRSSSISLYDEIVIRNISGGDLENLQKTLGSCRAHYLPDLCFSDEHLGSKVEETALLSLASSRRLQQQQSPLRIAVCLAQPYFFSVGRAFLEHIWDALNSILRGVGRQDIVFSLIPFNLSDKTTCADESDFVWMDNLVQISQQSSSITTEDARILFAAATEEQEYASAQIVARRFAEKFDAVIAHRYHAHVVSVLAGIPFVSIETTRKVKLFNEGEARTCSDLIISSSVFDLGQAATALETSIRHLLGRLDFYQQHQWQQRANLVSAWTAPYAGLYKIRQLLKTYYCISDENVIKTSEIFQNGGNFFAPICTKQVFVQSLANYFSQNLHDLLAEAAKNGGGEEEAEKMCFLATAGRPASEYVYGTTQRLVKYSCDEKKKNESSGLDFRGMFDYIVSQEMNKRWVGVRETPLSSAGNNKFVTLYLDMGQDVIGPSIFSGIHRCGWNFVIQILRMFSPPPTAPPMFTTKTPFAMAYSTGFCGGVICDVYLDRTFSWGRRILSNQAVIPYTSPWIGFLHHCFHAPVWYSKNTADSVVECPEFIASLRTCKVLVCLSEYLAAEVSERLLLLGLPHPSPPVVAIMHPTRLYGFPMWRDKARQKKEEVRLISVGAWYRNIWTFFALAIPRRMQVQKILLRARNTDGYYPPEKQEAGASMIFDHDEDLDLDRLSKFERQMIEALGGQKSAKRLRSEIFKKFAPHEVKHLGPLDNDDYDALISDSNSVIFLHLIDASAVNTVIECLARGTPLIVNRHPAVEEYLGKEYPLFYSSTSVCSDGVSATLNPPIEELLSSEKISATNKYYLVHGARLRARLSAEKFIDEMNTIISKYCCG